uniref:Uncharacterized protein n=1 Tax=Leersia perrieri TaxID=77586 RepID=A0A0D9VHN7_9ORYZ
MVVRQAAARRPCADAAVEPAGQGRKRAVRTRGGVGRIVFDVGAMSSAARRRLAARFESELACVRAVLRKAAGAVPAASGAGKSGLRGADSSSSSPGKRKDGRLLPAGGGAPARKRKACFLSGRGEDDAPKKKRTRTPEWPDVGKRLLTAAQIGGDGEMSRRNHPHGSKTDKPQAQPVPTAPPSPPLVVPDDVTDYGEMLAGTTGVDDLLSPLQSRYIALAERPGGGDVFAPALSPLLPPGYGGDLAGAAGVRLLSPLPREHVALAGVAASPSLPPGYGDVIADATGAVAMLSPLPREHVALATGDDGEEYVDICGDSSPIVINHKINHGEIITNNSSPISSSTSSDSDSTSSDESDSTGSTPTPAIPTNAKKQEENLPDPAAAVAATAKPLTDLIARAQGAVSRRRQEAREKARQELEEMETKTPALMSTNAVHPQDMELLGLAAVEHMVSSDVEEVRRALCFGSAALRAAAPSWPSLVEKLGLFLKCDRGGDKEEEEEQQQQPATSFGGGVDDNDDVEEGEIR